MVYSAQAFNEVLPKGAHVKKGIQFLTQLFCHSGLSLMIVACSQNPRPAPQKDSKTNRDFNSGTEICSEETIQDYRSVDWLLAEKKKRVSEGAHSWDVYIHQKVLATACRRLEKRFHNFVACQVESEEIHWGAFKAHCREAQRVSEAPLCPKEYLEHRQLIKNQSDQLRVLTFASSETRYSDEVLKLAKKLDENCRRFFKNDANRNFCMSESPSQRTDLFEMMTPEFPQSCDLAQKIAHY